MSIENFVVLAQAASPSPPPVYPPAGYGGPSPSLLLELVLACCALSVFISHLVVFLVRKVRRANRVRVMWLDPDAKGYGEEWVKRVGNEVRTKIAGQPARVILEGAGVF